MTVKIPSAAQSEQSDDSESDTEFVEALENQPEEEHQQQQQEVGVDDDIRPPQRGEEEEEEEEEEVEYDPEQESDIETDRADDDDDEEEEEVVVKEGAAKEGQEYQSDDDEGPPRKRVKNIHSRPRKDMRLNNESYKAFYNKELDWFLNGPTKTTAISRYDFPNSYVSCIDSKRATSEFKTSKFLGSYWTTLEKDIFFEFLGRYGISQIERIKQRLPNKSILEIMTYYNLLVECTNSVKKHPSASSRLTKYYEIPQAIEVDITTLELEDCLSRSVIMDEIEAEHKLKEEEIQLKFDQDEIENDSEENVLNMKVLSSMCEFYQMDHLRWETDFYNKGTKPRLGHSAIVIKSIIENYIREIVFDLIKLQIYKTTSTDALHFKTKQNGDKELTFQVHRNEIYKSVGNLRPQRTFLLKHYFKYLGERLDFIIEDDEYYKGDEGEDTSKFYKLLDFYRTVFTFVETPRLKLIEMVYGAPQEKLDLPDEEMIDKKIRTQGKGGFDDTALDNRLALKLFWRENYEIEARDHKESKTICSKMVETWKHVKFMNKFKPRMDPNDDNDLEPDLTIEQLYQEIEQDESLNDEGTEDVEIIDELIFLENLTYSQY